MALAISNIPILTGDVAENFVRNAEYNSREAKRTDFTTQRTEWSSFEAENASRINQLKATGQWPF